MVCQNFKFLCQIRAQIDFRSLHGRMAEPKRHLSKVAGGFKDMYGAGMVQDMCSDMLAGYGWLDFLCGLIHVAPTGVQSPDGSLPALWH